MGDENIYWPIKVEAASLERQAAIEAQRPSVLFRPHLGKCGNMWSALYGDNIAEGVCGFGETPESAMRDFDKSWTKKMEVKP